MFKKRYTYFVLASVVNVIVIYLIAITFYDQPFVKEWIKGTFQDGILFGGIVLIVQIIIWSWICMLFPKIGTWWENLKD